MKRRLTGVGILIGFVLSILMVSGVFAAKDEIVFDASNGKVTFSHKKHNETLKGTSNNSQFVTPAKAGVQ